MDVLTPKWSGRLLKLCNDISEWSKDQSTRVGAMITTQDGSPVSWGFNGMPMGVDDTIESRHERPEKYRWMAHAERNAMDLAPRGDLSGCVMFVNFSPCPTCSQSIIQRKIATVVVDERFTADKMPDRWKEDMLMAVEMLREAGVNVLSAKSD